MKKIIIVNGGGRGLSSASKGSYDEYVKLLTEDIDSRRTSHEALKNEEKLVTFEVVESEEDILNFEEVKVIVFVTYGKAKVAQRVAAEHPTIKVITTTALLEGLPYIVPKEILTSKDLYNLALSG